MKNTKIEKVLKAWEEGNFELGLSPESCQWCRRYAESEKKGFDEIVINDQECIHESEVKEMLEAARELKIEYFVYASGFSGAFAVVNEMVKNGARVGKFVTKSYKETLFGEEQDKEVSGLRINL